MDVIGRVGGRRVTLAGLGFGSMGENPLPREVSGGMGRRRRSSLKKQCHGKRGSLEKDG
jgi:hypothetical protein